MTKKHLAYSILVAVIAAAGCGSNTVKKPRDGSADDASSGGTGGGTGGISGTGGVGTGGVSGTGGVGTGGTSGTGGAVVEPPAQDAGPDATSDAQSDGGDASTDAITDGGDAAVTCTNPLCTLGDKRCGTGGLETCVAVNGCPAWGTATACGANRTCTGTGAAAACTCVAPPAVCTSVGTYCSAGNVRSTCEMINGCLALSTTTKTCGTNQTCTGNLPSGDCVCNAAPAGCTAAGTFCPTTTSVGTCAQDTDGCFVKSGNDTTCMNGQICVKNGATAACQCPTLVGTTLGTACNTVGQTICSGDTVLTCTMNATSGCKAWVLTTDCAASNAGLTCGDQGGPAACQCPAVTNGTYYVDPVAGNDVSNASPFPTGAKTPAACRFKTLGKASNVAVASGNKIVAVTATLPGVFTESAPITVAGGVTLTTDDATPTPANYRIDYTGSTADTAVVSLSNGSTFSGFTVRNANTAGVTIAVTGVRCTAGTVTVNRVNLEGTSPNGANMMATGLQIGTAPINTCTGTFSNLNVDGFATNISVSTSAGTAPIISSTIVNNITPAMVGLLVEAGTVNTADLRIQPRAGTVSAGYGVIVRPTSAVLVANYLGTGTSIESTANDGVRLENVVGMTAPQATLVSPVIQNATGAGSSGIVVERGVLNITGTGQIISSDQYGIEISGGAIIGTGLEIASSSVDGVHLTGSTSSLTLHRTTIRNSVNRNVFASDGALLIDDGSVIRNATGSGVEFVPAATNNFKIGGATGDRVIIRENGGHGVTLTGVGSTTAVVLVQRADIHANSLNGVNVALTGNANGVTFLDSVVFSNTLNGVVITAAPATNAIGVTLDTMTVRNHTGIVALTGRGIWLHGNDATSENITATIKNSTVHSNRDTGIVIDEDMPGGHTTETVAYLTGNDIYDNNLNGGAVTSGGILFGTSSTLAAFAANKIHHNGGDQLTFLNKPTTGTIWDLDAPGACSTAADAQQNKIYCYTLAGAVGIRMTAPNPAGAYDVDADQIGWANATVMAGREYVEGANTDITFAGACTAVTTCP